MASKYSIETVFRLIDNISKPLDRIVGQGNAVGGALKNSFIKAQQRVDGFGKTVEKATSALNKASIAAVGAGVAAAGAFTVKGVKNAAEYATGLAKVATIADTSKVSMSAMSEDILRLSSKMGTGVNDLSESVYQAISAGVATDKAVGLVGVASKAAIGGFTDTATAIDGLTSVLNAYGLSADRATDIADQMIIAQNLGKTSFGAMAQTMGQVIPTASALNVSTQELFSSVAALTANAIPTSQAMTGLKAVLSNVIKPSTNAAKMAERLGIQFNAAALESKGFAAFIEEIGRAVNGDKEKLGQLFGSVEAVNTVLALTGPGAELFSKALAGMGNSAGAVERAFSTMMDTPQKRFELLMNKISNIGIRLGQLLLPVLEKIMDKAGLFIEELEKIDFGPFVSQVESAIDRIFSSLNFEVIAKNISNFFTSIMNGAQMFIGLAEAVWKLRMPIVAIVGTVSILNGVMTALAVGEKIYTGIKKILTGASYAYLIVVKGQTHALGFLAAETNGVKLATAAWSVVMKAWNGIQYLGGLIKIGAQLAIAKAQTLAMAAAQHVAAAAQWVLNVAMSANPIALIIMGIGILIGLIILAVKHWKKITEAINENQNKVLALISVFAGPFGLIFSVINELRNNWEMIVGAFKTDGIIAGLKALGGVLVSALLAPVQGFLEILAKIPVIGEKIAPAVGKIEEFRNSLKGTNDTIEKPLLPRPVPRQVNSTTPTNPAPAAATPARATTTQNITPPMIPSPATATRTSGTAAQWGVMQPALLNLRAGTNPAPAAALIPGASPWLAEAAVTGGVDEVTPSAIMAVPAVTRTVSAGVSPAPAARTTATGTAQGPVRVPVEYVFPEMLIPADIIKTIMVPVELALASALPPRRAGPLPLAGPVSGSVGLGISPPEAPMTQAEQIVYSRIDNYENVKIEVSPEGGTSARIITPPKSPHVELLISGDV